MEIGFPITLKPKTGGDHWNRTSPIFPYEGNAQTIYARSPNVVEDEGSAPSTTNCKSVVFLIITNPPY